MGDGREKVEIVMRVEISGRSKGSCVGVVGSRSVGRNMASG